MATIELVSQQALANDLKARIRGAVLRASDAGYDDARSVWNAMIDRRPAVIVRCPGVADVVASVEAARQHGVALSIKGGGDNIAGLAVCDGALLLDMYRSLAARAPRELTVVAALRLAPPAPWLRRRSTASRSSRCSCVIRDRSRRARS